MKKAALLLFVLGGLIALCIAATIYPPSSGGGGGNSNGANPTYSGGIFTNEVDIGPVGMGVTNITFGTNGNATISGILTNNTINNATNIAAIASIANPLTTGVTYNNGNYRGFLTGTIMIMCPTNSSVLAFLTNLTSTECQWFTNKENMAALGGGIMFTNSQNFAMMVGPNESVQFTNFSGVTNFFIQKSFLRIW